MATPVPWQKLSTHWFPKYESSRTNGTQGEERKTESYVWGAAIVKVFLRGHIQLWETRNRDVHSDKHNTDTRQKLETFQRCKAICEIKKLYTMEDKVSPNDSFLFPNLDILLAKDTASLREYLSSHRKVIRNSVKKWSHQYKQGARSIVGWISAQSKQNTWEMEYSNRRKRKRKRLLDGREKETQKKTKSKTTHTNKIIQDYFQSILITPYHTKRKRRTLLK